MGGFYDEPTSGKLCYELKMVLLIFHSKVVNFNAVCMAPNADSYILFLFISWNLFCETLEFQFLKAIYLNQRFPTYGT